MNVIVTGTIGYDYIMDFDGRFSDRIMADKIHKISLSFLVDKLNKQFGGTAGNIAYTLKLLGLEPLIVSTAGNDYGPYKAFQEKRGISVKFIKEYEDVGTGSYFVVTDKEDNQIGSFYTGATKYAKDLSVAEVPKKDFVVVAPTDPTAMKKYVAECCELNIPYLYDPAFQIATFTPEELKTGIEGSKILIGNDYEIALIEQKLEISREELRVMVPVIITTLGSRGSVIETSKQSIHIQPAKPTNISDPTGAGDAFRAGFLAGYLRGFDLVTSGQMGSVAAAYTVETYGTQTHDFSRQDFVKRYGENFGEIISL